MDFNSFFSQDFAERVTNNTLSDSEKESIKEIYGKVKRTQMVETCHNCFTDAYFVLYNLYKSDKKRFNALYSCEYRMPAGAVVSVFGETNSIMTAANITNELAEYHLKRNNDVLKDFSSFPQDWEQRIKEPVKQAKTVVKQEVSPADTEPEKEPVEVIPQPEKIEIKKRKAGRPPKK